MEARVSARGLEEALRSEALKTREDRKKREALGARGEAQKPQAALRLTEITAEALGVAREWKALPPPQKCVVTLGGTIWSKVTLGTTTTP